MTQSIDHHGRVIVFRTDASVQIGTGHVMRCLTLADALSEQGAICHFICREHSGHMIEAIRARGHQVHPLPEGAATIAEAGLQAPDHADWLGTGWATDAGQSREVIDVLHPGWLVVDHYALDARWERAVTQGRCRLLVIDDLADRPHVADLLLDQNLGRNAEDYHALVPAHCQVLAGPRYALLRPEFTKWRDSSLARRESPELQQILVTMGGVDKDNATGRVLDALKACDLPEDCRISVVMGASAPWLESVKDQAARMPWPTEVAVNVNDMAQRMVHADLAIGAAGSTAWERCCLGLPTLMLVLADNQQNIAAYLHDAGAATALGTPEDLATLSAHWRALTQPDALQAMAQAAATIADGKGPARLCESLTRDTSCPTAR